MPAGIRLCLFYFIGGGGTLATVSQEVYVSDSSGGSFILLS